MATLGELSLWMALLMSLWAGAASIVAGRRSLDFLAVSSRRGLRATLAFLLVALVALTVSLATRDFSVGYVAAHTSSNLPHRYLIASLCAGPGGILLLGSVALAVSTLMCARAAPTARTVAFCGSALAAGVAAVALFDPPFHRGGWITPDGRGLAPAMQHLAYSLHAPLLAAGLPAAAVALAVLVWLRPDAPAARPVRQVLAVSWFLTTCGLLAGLWWRYSVSGWTDAWQLHPVRNATAFAWLVITVLAFRGRRTDEPAVAGLRQNAKAPEWRLLMTAAAGLALLLVGLAVSASGRSYRLAVPAGVDVNASDGFGAQWRFVGAGVSRYDIENYRVAAVAISAFRGESRAGLLPAEMRQYVDARGAPVSAATPVAGALHTPTQSVQGALVGFDTTGAPVVAIAFHPLVLLVWVGGALLAAAGFVLLWRPRRHGD